jgi:AraC-like DNA-binding protein
MPSRATPVRTNQPVAATPMAFARSIVAAYRRYGANPAEALKLAQITPLQLNEVHGHITARQLEVLSGTAMQALDDEGLGAFSRRLPWGSYGMLARASISSPDLGMALKRWCRHHGLLVDDIVLRVVTTSGDSTAITIEEGKPGSFSKVGEFGLVHVLRNIHGLACWYVDSRIPLQGASFPFDAPPHEDAYALMFQGGLQFKAAQAGIRFDARYLALPLRRDEKALTQMLQRALPLTVLQYRRDRLLVGQVRQALANSSALQVHNAETLAAVLNMSARSLHRQLQEEGASLQQLKDEVRFEKAKDLLLRTSKPIKQVAAASGFRNEKSFIRAFQGWAGTSPAEFRRSVDR